MSKFTKSSAKAFIKKHLASGKLMVRFDSDFDGMTDCVQQNRNAEFKKAEPEEMTKNNLGVKGVWFVNGSRDYFACFKYNEKSELISFQVYNCCGSFTLAVE